MDKRSRRKIEEVKAIKYKSHILKKGGIIMNNQNNNNNNGVGFVGLLTILFIGLKLTDTITWSWFWVLSPLWISCILAVIFIIVFCSVAAVSKNKKRW